MMMSAGGDETFLEAFVESLSALPHDVKRSLELLKDLDARCGDGTAQLLRRQQQYLEEAEARMMELEIVLQRQPQQQQDPTSEATEQDGDDDSMEIDHPTAASATYAAGLRVLGEGSRRAVVIPTTLELEQYVHAEQQGGRRPRYEEIAGRQRDVLQLADEKVAVASQLYDRMDGTVRRLDRDLAEMELLLQVRAQCKRGNADSRSRGGNLDRENSYIP
jgi:Inhibitor of growth proteins N-terminal histone-binding